MSRKYFIKRGDKVYGPLTGKQLKNKHESQSLKSGDLVAESSDGPWKPVGVDFQNPNSSNDIPDLPEVSVGLTCEDCGEALNPLDQSCPACGCPIDLVPEHFSDENVATTSFLSSLADGNQPHAPNAAHTDNIFGKEATFDKFSLGFLVNPKPFLSGPIYCYQNSDFPALAAAIRYYSFIARLAYYIIVILLVLSHTLCFLAVVVGVVAQLGDGNLLVAFGLFSSVAILALTFALGMLFCNLWLVVSLASCEVARVLLQIELNTRNGQ